MRPSTVRAAATTGRKEPEWAKRRTPARNASAPGLPVPLQHPQPGTATRGGVITLLRRQLTIAVVEQRQPHLQGSLQWGFAPAPPPLATVSESFAAAPTEEIVPMTPCIQICPATRLYVATNE